MVNREKIIANSFYPLLGNDTFYFEGAELAKEITDKGRELLNKMKQTYIVVANVDLLGDKGFCDTFLNGTEDDIIAFCDDNYDREDCELGVYPIDTFVSEVNNDHIDFENSFIRKIVV